MAEIKEKDIVSVTEGDETFQGVVVKVKEVNCDIKFDGKDEPEPHRIENVTLVESYEEGTGGENLEDTEARLIADREQLEKDQAELADQQASLKEQQDQVSANISKSITISETQVDFGKFNKVDNPIALKAEQAKQAKYCEARKANRIAKAKKAATMTAVQIREGVLRARLTTVRKKRYHRFTKEQIDIWARELTIIQQTPDAWSPGCVRPKEQISALDKLDNLGD